MVAPFNLLITMHVLTLFDRCSFSTSACDFDDLVFTSDRVVSGIRVLFSLDRQVASDYDSDSDSIASETSLYGSLLSPLEIEFKLSTKIKSK